MPPYGLLRLPRRTSAQPRVTIGYVEIAGDPRYEPVTGYGRVVLKSRERPFVGAQVGIDDAQSVSRALKIDFALERISVTSAAEAAAAVPRARDSRGIHFFIADVPAEAFEPLADAIRGRDILIFNATAADDTLRRNLCAAEIVHTLPSLAMSMDGLVAIPRVAQMDQSPRPRRSAARRCRHGQGVRELGEESSAPG